MPAPPPRSVRAVYRHAGRSRSPDHPRGLRPRSSPPTMQTSGWGSAPAAPAGYAIMRAACGDRIDPELPRIPLLFAALVVAPGIASAQRVDTTAASEADDAFGLSIAGETIGLYSDEYVRGFSPVNAGNLRLDGLYIDRQANFNERLFNDVAVRVGATALATPLPAPSGIADYSLRRPGPDDLLSVAGGVASFGSPFLDVDWTVGGTEGVALAAGLSLYPDENEQHG